MYIFTNYFYYFIVFLNIIIGSYNDIHNIRYLKIRYVDDLFKHKNHIYAYILCRCYFNGAIIGFLLYHIVYLFNLIYLPYFKYIFDVFIILSHFFYVIDNIIENKKFDYKDILAIYGFHTGYINLVK